MMMQRRQQTRYDSVAAAGNFVAPDRRTEPVVVDAGADIEPQDIATVFQPMQSPSMDSTSAMDRVNAFNRRLIFPAVLLVAAGGLSVVAYILALSLAGIGINETLAPRGLDRVFVFLVVVVVIGLTSWDRESGREYQHTSAGIERHRISTAADVRKHEIEALTTIKVRALEASLKLLEDRNRGND